MIRKKETLYHYLLLGLLFLLSACRTTTGWQETRDEAELPTTYYAESADRYWQLAATENSPQRETLQLDAIGRLLQDGMYQRAKQLSQRISYPSLTPQQKQRLILYKARLALIAKKAPTTITLLTQFSAETYLNPFQQIEYYELLAKAYEQNGQVIQSAAQRVKLIPLLANTRAAKSNQRKILHLLQDAEPLRLQEMQQLEPHSALNSWITLALILQEKSDGLLLKNQLQDWKKQHPNHPANTLLATTLSKPIQQSAAHIALLLPLTGHLAAPGKAVRDGFMSAYYANKHSRTAPIIRIYNTHQQNVTDLYQKAVRDGAQLVIGPLGKRNVTQLLRSGDISIPTLALNYTEQSNDESYFYEFGISPLDEAYQVARKAWHDGHKEVIVIAPQTTWGQTVAKTFTHQWQQLGGRIVGHLAYRKNENFSVAIKQLLHVDKSRAQDKQLQRVLGQKIKTVPRRRQDADLIFLVADPNTARQIRPLLTFYYAGELPVYASSLIYTGTPEPKRDTDLEGIIFCDMPWVFQQQVSQSLQKQMASLWPQGLNHYTRLYALGLDAYKIAQQLPQLNVLPTFGLHGKTGHLYLKQQRIYRDLQWAQFRRGRPYTL